MIAAFIPFAIFFFQKFVNSLKSPLEYPMDPSSPTSNGIVMTDISSNGIQLTKMGYNGEPTKVPLNGGDYEKGRPYYSDSGEKLYPHINDSDDYWGRQKLLNHEDKTHNHNNV